MSGTVMAVNNAVVRASKLCVGKGEGVIVQTQCWDGEVVWMQCLGRGGWVVA